MDKPKVTIGLCVKNCEDTIDLTLDSLITQSYPHNLIEIIVVDDGCKDNTISTVIEKLSKTDLSFKILKTEGKGLGPARQIVVDNATGKYIIWIDGDMTIPTEHILKQVDFMENNPHLGRARANWAWIESEGFLPTLQKLAYTEKNSNIRQSELSGTGGSIFRVRAIRDAGGFDINIRGAGEDVDIAIRMLSKGWGFSVSDTYFYHKPKTSWKELWGQYFWYGSGAYYVSQKHKINITKLARPILLALAVGIVKAIVLFKLTNQKIAFLLPIFFLFTSSAWWFGFFKAYIQRAKRR